MSDAYEHAIEERADLHARRKAEQRAERAAAGIAGATICPNCKKPIWQGSVHEYAREGACQTRAVAA